MSHAAASAKTPMTRVIQAAALASIGALMLLVAYFATDAGLPARLIGALGFLLLAGMLASELLGLFGLPHLTGYIAAGAIAGPHVLHLVSHDTVEHLQPVNTLALALIALAGGAELRLSMLRDSVRSLAWTSLFQSTLPLLGMVGVFIALAPKLDFLQGLPFQAVVGIGLLWGVTAVSRSPAATLAILSQTRARGPLATFTLAFVMLSDVVVILMLVAVMAGVGPLIVPGKEVSLNDFVLVGREIVGSISIGTCLGLVLATYLRLVGRQPMLVLVAVGFCVTEALRYIHFDPLLTFLIAGFVVQNVTQQGEKLLNSIEQTSSVVFVVFFATAGAHLDLPLLVHLWQAALILCVARAVFSAISHSLAMRVAKDVPQIRRWGWAPLVSQAGITLGIALTVERTFPEFGRGFQSLAIATVAINEVVGPVLFKLALDRTGETRVNAAAEANVAVEAE